MTTKKKEIWFYDCVDPGGFLSIVTWIGPRRYKVEDKYGTYTRTTPYTRRTQHKVWNSSLRFLIGHL